MLLIVLALVISVCLSFIFALKFWNWTTEADQKISQDRAIKVVEALEPRMTRDQVVQVLKEHRWTSYIEEDTEIRLWTRPQPLATNWTIRLCFENEALVAIKYGTADNISKRPKDAPPDMLFSPSLPKKNGEKEVSNKSVIEKAIAKFEEVNGLDSYIKYDISVRETTDEWEIDFDGKTKLPGNHALVIIIKRTGEVKYFQGE